MKSFAKNALQPVADFYRRVLPLSLGTGRYVMYSHSESMEVADERFFRKIFLYDDEYASCGVVVVGNATTRRYVLVGALTAWRSLTHFTVRLRGAVPDSIEVRQEDIPGDGSMPSEELVVLEGDDWCGLLKRYARLAAEKNGVKPMRAVSSITGYLCWYYYYDTVSEADFLENAEYMYQARKNGTYPAELIQLDDGYQACQGDWLELAPTWTTSLQEIARGIAEHGHTPGIWIMPFVAATTSRLFREHPQWFVKDLATGEPKVFCGWAQPPNHQWLTLDATNPEVIAHFKTMFRTLHDWGFRYFKLDGMGFALQTGRRHDPAATPVSAYRAGLQAIREAIPDDFILGCNAPYTPTLGFCNANRVSRDIAADWEMVRDGWKETIARFWMYDTWYRCDPDVVVVREELGTLTPGEARFSALTGIVTGVAITSDKLPFLSPERLAMLTKAAQFHLQDVTPVEWPEDEWPEVIHGTLNGRHAAAVFNWRDTPRTYTLEQLGFPPNRQLKDLMGAVRTVWGGLNLPPHDAALIVERV